MVIFHITCHMGLATIPIIPSFDLSMICRGTATLGESMGALLSTKPGTVEVALGCLNSGQMWPNVAKCGQMSKSTIKNGDFKGTYQDLTRNNENLSTFPLCRFASRARLCRDLDVRI
jgi:hypothetical protein